MESGRVPGRGRAGAGAAMLPSAQQVGLQRAASPPPHPQEPRTAPGGQQNPGAIQPIRWEPGNARAASLRHGEGKRAAFWGAKPTPVRGEITALEWVQVFHYTKRNSSFATRHFERTNLKEAEKLRAGWG